jgi:hypothetical protein
LNIVGSRALSASVMMRAVGVNERIGHNVKCVHLGFERLKGGCNILRSVNCEWRNFNAERTSRGLDLAHLQH